MLQEAYMVTCSDFYHSTSYQVLSHGGLLFMRVRLCLVVKSAPKSWGQATYCLRVNLIDLSDPESMWQCRAACVQQRSVDQIYIRVPTCSLACWCAESCRIILH